MAHTHLFSRLMRSLRLAQTVATKGISTAEGLERRDEALSRRSLLKGVGAAGATAAVAACAPVDDTDSVSQGARSTARIVVVGAGLGGLTAAYRLTRKGYAPEVYDANERAGGRCFSLRDAFATKCEMGGELIDSGHVNVQRLARDLGLTLLDQGGATASLEAERYVVGNRRVPESEIVDQFRAVLPVLDADYASLGRSEYVTYDESTAAGRRIDRESISEWFDRAHVHGSFRALLDTAYTAEYGLEVDQQSYLNLLSFISRDPAAFALFGDSDERYTIGEGNDAMVSSMISALPSPVRLGHALVAVRARSDGRVLAVFDHRGRTVEVVADRLVLALPFNQLRRCELSVPIQPAKRRAINRLAYGTNAKVMIGTSTRPWVADGSAGVSFHDRVFNESWDSSRGYATAGAALTSFTGGRLGVAVGAGTALSQGRRFADEIDTVYPGVARAYTGRTARMHWPTARWFEGSYGCYRPGDYGDFVGSEAEPSGVVHFCGEHTSAEAQGFLEGAVESGNRVANEIRRALGGA